eukprot:scaffold8659_cov129-Isochrysis_galbana.AAC.2
MRRRHVDARQARVDGANPRPTLLNAARRHVGACATLTRMPRPSCHDHVAPLQLRASVVLRLRQPLLRDSLDEGKQFQLGAEQARGECRRGEPNAAALARSVDERRAQAGIRHSAVACAAFDGGHDRGHADRKHEVEEVLALPHDVAILVGPRRCSHAQTCRLHFRVGPVHRSAAAGDMLELVLAVGSVWRRPHSDRLRHRQRQMAFSQLAPPLPSYFMPIKS